MKRGALIAGLISGALCAGCVFAYSVQVRGEADEARIEAMQRYGGEQVDVLVATKDIYPGETVDASNAEVKTWLSDLLPSGCLTSFDDVKGAQAASLIISGEAISQRRFDSAGSGIDVPQGCVALSVPAEDVQALVEFCRQEMLLMFTQQDRRHRVSGSRSWCWQPMLSIRAEQKEK